MLRQRLLSDCFQCTTLTVVLQDDMLDTRNFDKEFTSLPAQLTPEEKKLEAFQRDIEQFTFYTAN